MRRQYPPRSPTTPQEGNFLHDNSSRDENNLLDNSFQEGKDSSNNSLQYINTSPENSPLEGCLKGGVDITHPLKGGVDIISSKLPESPDWARNSLFPYWSLPKNQKLRDRAKELRKQGILSEVIFWQCFKDKKKLGWDMDRQVIIGHYIVDFFIPELGLIFEIDGSSHDERQEYDAERNTFLEGLGLSVIHILDAHVKNNMEEIYEYVHLCIQERERFFKDPI